LPPTTYYSGLIGAKESGQLGATVRLPAAGGSLDSGKAQARSATLELALFGCLRSFALFCRRRRFGGEPELAESLGFLLEVETFKLFFSHGNKGVQDPMDEPLPTHGAVLFRP
jgi:hypothetical protein